MSAFLAVKQGSRSVDDYALAFRKAQMLTQEVPDQMATTLFIQGLQPTIGAEVTRHVPPTL